jgi:hypothetical protein
MQKLWLDFRKSRQKNFAARLAFRESHKKYQSGARNKIGNEIEAHEILSFYVSLCIIASKFSKLPRAWFCSDRPQISAENRIAILYTVKKKFCVYFFLGNEDFVTVLTH